MILHNFSCSVAEMNKFFTEKNVIGVCENQQSAELVYYNFCEWILGSFVEAPWKFGCPGSIMGHNYVVPTFSLCLLLCGVVRCEKTNCQKMLSYPN